MMDFTAGGECSGRGAGKNDAPLLEEVVELFAFDDREPGAVARVLQRLDKDRSRALGHRAGERLDRLGRLELAGLVGVAIHRDGGAPLGRRKRA